MVGPHSPRSNHVVHGCDGCGCAGAMLPVNGTGHRRAVVGFWLGVLGLAE